MALYSLFQSLPDEAESKILKTFIKKKYKRGEYIYRQGDTPLGLFFIEKGLVSLMLLGVSGKEHLVRFFIHGQFFGHRSYLSKEQHHGSAMALEPTAVYFLSASKFGVLLSEYPLIYKNIAQVLAQELGRCEKQRLLVLENEVLSRTALALVYLKELHPEYQWTRQEIADFCASTTSTVIKAMAELEDRGLIAQEKRSIKILSKEGLIALQDS